MLGSKLSPAPYVVQGPGPLLLDEMQTRKFEAIGVAQKIRAPSNGNGKDARFVIRLRCC
jgi:hypothetical protein